MTLYSLTADTEGSRASVLLQALSGWVDAGSAGTATADFLSATGRVVATFDPDALFDYRSNRPILDFVDGEINDLVWPKIEVRFTASPGPLLVLNGLEPDLRWQDFSASVFEMAERFGVTKLMSVGAVPAAVPHTLPAPVMMTASKKALLTGRVPEGTLRVPSAALSAVDHFFANRGFDTIGFWAQVPHYVTDEYEPAVLALVEKAAEHLGVSIETEELRRKADDQRRRLDEIVATRPEARAYVERLENIASAELSTGEQIASEVERFLREVGGENPFEG